MIKYFLHSNAYYKGVLDITSKWSVKEKITCVVVAERSLLFLTYYWISDNNKFAVD